MAFQNEPSPHRSALEFEIHHETTAGLQLVRYDPTANAPERDHDVDAPECDLTFAVPQGLLQVAHDQSLPEAVVADTFPQKITPTICGLERKKFWRLFFVLSVIVAIAVGTSVGIAARTRSTTSPSQPSNTLLPVRRTILSGSALAAITLSNGDRRLFFQDASGAIRESLYTTSTGQWTANVNGIVATDAKLNTPLAAIKFPNPSDKTFLFYIALNDSVTLRASAHDSWAQASTGISDFLAANDTRLLSAALTSGDVVTPGGFMAALVFQDASGQVRRLYLRDRDSSWTVDPDFPPKNVTFNPNDRCKLEIITVSDGPREVMNPPTLAPTQPFPDNLDVAQVTFSTGGSRISNIYLLTVNGTAFELLCRFTDTDKSGVFLPDLASSPISPFPFARLAATSLTNGSSAFYVYHQINNTTFAEDIYDTLKGVWTSTNFTTPVT